MNQSITHHDLISYASNLIFMQGREHLQKRFPNLLKNLSFIYYSTNIYGAPTTCKGLEVLILHLWFYFSTSVFFKRYYEPHLWWKIKA